MAWKVLIFLAIIAVGVSAGRYELKGKKKTQLHETLATACKDFANKSQRNQLTGLAMEAFECLYQNVDKLNEDLVPTNATSEAKFLDSVSRICAIRLQLRECAQQVLEYMAPCTCAPVQAQVGDMKVAITELFKQFCDDDMAKTRRFIDDGGVACVDNKLFELDNCTSNLERVVTLIPDDTHSFEAIEMCYKYDTMTSCILDSLSDCPKPSTQEFTKNMLALFRSGTFCRAAVPVQPSGNDIIIVMINFSRKR